VVVDQGVVTHVEPPARTIVTTHLIAAPDGWWETYDPVVDDWEAKLPAPERTMIARIAAYIVLDAPLLRRDWVDPEPDRPADSWEGLDAEELLSHEDLARCPPHLRLSILRLISKFVDHLGALGMIPSDVWSSIREGYDDEADQLRDAWLSADVEASADRVPFRRPPKIGRNEPCPCGSGSKYKRCCGSN